MNFEEFKKIFKSMPCKIIAKTDENNITEIQMEGRRIELIATSLAISKDVLEKSHLSVDTYCEILKKGCEEENIKKEENIRPDDEEIKEMISKLVDAIFG